MENNQVKNEKILEQVNGGHIYPSVTVDGNNLIQCPFCNTLITGKTKEECMRNYEIHSKICYTSII